MQIEYDRAKDASDREKHGISLADAVLFEWETAHIEEDVRHDYGEQRFQATGFIGEKLYRLVFTWRGENARIISLRRANPREEKYHVNRT